MTRIRVSTLCARLLAICAVMAAAGCSSDDRSTGVREEPLVLPDNPSCADLGLGTLLETKIEPPVSGTYSLVGAYGEVVVTVSGVYFDWSAALGMDAVIVKGGPDAEVYVYDPEAMSDTGLHAPINSNTGQPYGLSHISFCYDLNVEVTKDAQTSLKRSHTWTIDKSADRSNEILSVGQILTVNYTVVVDQTFADSDWGVTGKITIFNPALVNATITGVSDLIDGTIAAPVDCGVSFPYTLAPGASLICDYEAALPDASTRTNVAAVTTSGPVGPDSGSASVDFSNATITHVDDCASVTDSIEGPLGSLCAAEAPKTFTYSNDIGPYATCGSEHQVPNIATLTTDDTSTSITDDWVVYVTIPACDVGCSLTPGYWKTHSSHGPAPYDDTWAMIEGGADAIFFLSGMSYYQVLWTPPQGNAYFILAHAYIAAVLNDLNGADVSAISAELAQAKTLFETYTPAQVGSWKGSARQEVILLAQKLDAYNNGWIGPGHCSE